MIDSKPPRPSGLPDPEEGRVGGRPRLLVAMGSRATIGAVPMTAEQFLQIEAPRPLQLVEGEVVVNEPIRDHQYLKGEFFRRLADWADAKSGRGVVSLSIDVLMDERNVFAPDVLWYDGPAAPGRHDPPPYPIPALAVEVRSPSTWRCDIGAKKAVYEREGLRELWLVDGPGATVLVFRRSAPGAAGFDIAVEVPADGTLTSPLLDGFALPLAPLLGS